jgi:hypothetical protein
MNTLKKQLIASLSLSIIALMVTFISPSLANAQVQDPGTTAFQQEGVEVFTTFWKRFDFVIPTGQRLVIERISALIVVPHAGTVIARTELQTTVNGSLVSHEFGKPTFQFATPPNDDYLLSLAPHVYADGGTISLIVIFLHVPLNLVNMGNVVISGHLVCPQALTCISRLGSLTPKADGTAKAEGTSKDVTVMAQTRPRSAKPSKRETVATLSRR